MESDFNIQFDSILKKVLGNRVTRADFSNLDSISFVELLISVQKTFRIKFSSADFAKLKTAEAVKSRALELINRL